MTSRQLRWWRWVHKWSSLICTLFLLILCVTGLPLIFASEIDEAMAPVARPAPPASQSDGPLDTVLAQALSRRNGGTPMSLTWVADHPHRLILWTAPRPMAEPRDFKGTILDLRDGEILAEPRPGVRPTVIIHAIHAELAAGLAGSLLLCAMGLLFAVAIVSGIVLYAPFMRDLPFATLRAKGARRTLWLDIHNFVGIAILAWMIVVGLTGVANTLAQPLFRLWQVDQLAAMIRPWQGKPIPRHVVSVGTAVASAQRHLPDMQPESLAYPYSRFGSPHHYIVWMKGNTALTARLETPVLIDAASGQVAEARPLPWYLRALEISRPLHFGDYGGMPLKLLWAGLDLATIAVLVTGLLLWIRPRRGRA